MPLKNNEYYKNYNIEKGMLNIYYPLKFYGIKDENLANKIQRLSIVLSNEERDSSDNRTFGLKDEYLQELLNKEQSTVLQLGSSVVA